jgi:hypothetical protein
LPEPPVTATEYGVGSPRRIRADPTLVADLGVALEQLGGEHDLVTKGGSLEVLFGGEGLQGERPLLALVAG